MGAESLVENARVRDAASCRAWLARLAAGESSLLSPVDRLMRNLARSTEAPDLVLEILEQARPVHLAELSGVFDRLDARTFPMAEPDRQRFVVAMDSLRLGRNLYRRLHQQLVEDSDAAAHTVIRGAVHSLRAVMPLARALDYQARMLLVLLRLKIAIDPAEWDELCTMARLLRASTFLDAPLPDERPLLPSMTSRALFVFPMMVWLARPEVRSDAEFGLIVKLARRWAGRVGFRLEEGGMPHDGKNGPSVELTERHWVRLVTHRLQRRLAEKRREIDALGPKAEARLPRGLGVQGTRRLLEELDELWVSPRTQLRVPDARLGRMKLRFGMPNLPPPGDAGGELPDKGGGARGGGSRASGAARAGSPAARPATWHSAASRAYIYGRFEQNTLIRMALGTDRGNADPLARWAAGAEQADWVSIERQQAVFEGTVSPSSLQPGALATVVAPPVDLTAGETPRHPSAEPSPKRMFGRVAAIQQSLGDKPRDPPRARVGVEVWSGSPQLVGVRCGSDPFFHDAWLLSPDPSSGEPTSLVMAAGSFGAPGAATLRESAKDTRIRLEELLYRGPDYDRVRISRASS
jgi:hypothetical protein